MQIQQTDLKSTQAAQSNFKTKRILPLIELLKVFVCSAAKVGRKSSSFINWRYLLPTVSIEYSEVQKFTRTHLVAFCHLKRLNLGGRHDVHATCATAFCNINKLGNSEYCNFPGYRNWGLPPHLLKDVLSEQTLEKNTSRITICGAEISKLINIQISLPNWLNKNIH